MNILVITDDPQLNKDIAGRLEKNGFHLLYATDRRDVKAALQTDGLELVIIDSLNALIYLQKIKNTTRLPVLLLAASQAEQRKVSAAGIRVDAGICYPAEMKHLSTQVQLLTGPAGQPDISDDSAAEAEITGLFRLDREKQCVYKDGEAIHLSKKEYKIIDVFINNPDRVITKERLYKRVWKEDIYADDNTIMVHICRLRKKIEDDPKKPEYIKTVQGIGYRFSPCREKSRKEPDGSTA